WNEEQIWAQDQYKGKLLEAEIFHITLAASVYYIWQERNQRIFQKNNRSCRPQFIYSKYSKNVKLDSNQSLFFKKIISLEHIDGLDTLFDGYNIRFNYYTINTHDTKNDRYILNDLIIDGWHEVKMNYESFYTSNTFYDPSKN
ncbi:hypothetical protein H5410_046020, partial [Solanum commersonii]